MIIVVESGASKTDWVAGQVKFRTKGINFSVLQPENIRNVVAGAAGEISGRTGRIPSGAEESAGIAAEPGEIWFYGAGLVSEEQASVMSGILQEFFPGYAVNCASDLLAAARALWGDSPGIVAILGTGSNSCRYNGRTITGNVRPGGFILGDEGGGAVLGKRFISDYIKDIVPERVAARFRERYGLKYHDIVNAVYKGQNPAGFLASFAPFVIENAETDGYCASMVRENLRDFVTRALLPYRKEDEVLKVGVAGSMGIACMNVLESVGAEYGIEFCKFVASPIDGLVEYHSDRRKSS